nr:hypothetical protein [Tanacetum cinerariifolium]
MALTFADTHNMIAHLTKSDAIECFEQILDFLNASVIQYALTVNPTIYVSCIKQFWSFVSIKKTNDVVRLQSLIDRKKVLLTEDTVRQAFHLDDAESIDCFPNEEIFAELARMGYEKYSTKLTLYKTFFQLKWKFLIHIILQRMSAKITARNEFSSSMASAIICLATSGKFNFSKYIFDSLVRNVDSSSKFYMYLRFLQLMISAQVGDLSSHTTKYTSFALTKKQAVDDVNDVVADDVIVDDIADVVAHAAAEPTSPSPTPTTTPLPSQELLSTSQTTHTPPPSPVAQPSSPPQQQQPSQPTTISMDLLNTLLETCTTLTRKGRLEESQAQVYHIDPEHADKVLSMKDDEPKPFELKEVIEVVITAKLMTKVVTSAATPIIVATITIAPNAAKKEKGFGVDAIEDFKEFTLRDYYCWLKTTAPGTS